MPNEKHSLALLLGLLLPSLAVGCATLGGPGESTPHAASAAPAAPTPAAPLAPYAELALGSTHTCGLRTDGSVWCWGSDARGSWGAAPPRHTTYHPTRVEGLPPVVELRAYLRDTCARTEDGHVFCWGDSYTERRQRDPDGRLPWSISDPIAPVPIPVEGATRLLIRGPAHCARLSGRAVRCWSGRLGRGAIAHGEDRYFRRDAPETVAELEGALEFGAACVLFDGGHLRCAGLERGSQPELPASELEDVAEVRSFVFGECARLRGGEVLCRGQGHYGQLGDGEDGEDHEDWRWQRVEGIPPSVQLAGDRFTLCSRSQDGRLSCWGDSRWGQIATPPPISERTRGVATPRFSEPQLLPLMGVERVGIGSHHICALRGGRIECWGYNAAGQLGRPSRVPGREEARPVPGIEGAVDLDVSAGRACALDRDGAVSCWGGWSYPEIPNALPQLRYYETRTGLRYSIEGLDGEEVTSITLGGEHGCALFASGEVACWGGGSCSAGGRPRQGVLSEAARISGLRDVRALTADHLQTCAVRENGEAHCWGCVNGRVLANERVRSPRRVRGLPPVRSVAAGELTTCFRSEGGLVHCWGVEPASPDPRALPEPAAVPTLEGALEIRLDHPFFGCARFDGGEGGSEVRCWHMALSGEGFGESRSRPGFYSVMEGMEPPSEVRALRGARSLAVSELRACALMPDGTVRCLDRPPTRARAPLPSPRPVPGLHGAVQLAIDGDGGCARTEDGRVWCWGSNRSGLFGEHAVFEGVESIPPEPSTAPPPP